jgi:hypothetical protein
METIEPGGSSLVPSTLDTDTYNAVVLYLLFVPDQLRNCRSSPIYFGI